MDQATDLGDATPLTEYLKRREMQCHSERAAYSRWLGVLTPLRWSMVGSSTVLSALAGASIFAELDPFGAGWQTTAGLCAFAASVLSGLHAAFNCDTYQEECRRLVQLFYGLEMSYQAAQLDDRLGQVERRTELDARFEEAISRAVTSPPEWCRRIVGRS